MSLEVQTGERLCQQIPFCDEKILWTAALEDAGSVSYALDEEDASKNYAVAELWEQNQPTDKGILISFRKKPAILGQEKTVGHVWVWLHHVTF